MNNIHPGDDGNQVCFFLISQASDLVVYDIEVGCQGQNATFSPEVRANNWN